MVSLRDREIRAVMPKKEIRIRTMRMPLEKVDKSVENLRIISRIVYTITVEKRSILLSRLEHPGFPTAAAAVLALSLLNLGLSWTNNVILKSPLFLDSIFTAVGAAVLGPWAGMGIGLLTNLVMEPIYGVTGFYWPFAACNMATGLIVGLMSRRGAFTQGWHATAAVVLVTLANALLGGFIANLVFSGDTGVHRQHRLRLYRDGAVPVVRELLGPDTRQPDRQDAGGLPGIPGGGVDP